MDTNILLESGTNELEVLEFIVGGNYYGINVAKVKEILPLQSITPVPNAHPNIEGVFMPRESIITVVNLGKAIGYFSGEGDSRDMLIITNFNNLNIAFHVNQVLGIHRVSWADIVKPDVTINGIAGNGLATGIIKKNDKLVIILDFEKIVEDICPETSLKVSDLKRLGERERCDLRILIAEDSPLLSKLISDSLNKAGYVNQVVTQNGQEAWDKMLELENAQGDAKVRCVVTDIEMPVMDGHRLVKLIRSDNNFEETPIIIFSSLINEDMKRKGERLGANAQISKPEIGKLVELIDKLIITSK